MSCGVLLINTQKNARSQRKEMGRKLAITEIITSEALLSLVAGLQSSTVSRTLALKRASTVRAMVSFPLWTDILSYFHSLRYFLSSH